VKILQLVLALPFLLALGVAGHALFSRALKAVLWSWSPLATGEPEAAAYERRVYHSADLQMLQIIGTAAAGGLLGWIAMAVGSVLVGVAGVLVVAAAVGLDILRWERVAVSASNLWFQRGFRGKVHQVALDNIRDLTVQEGEVRGFTLRHGRRNRSARLQVRLNDKRVIALPKTDAHSSLDAVESVANHLRMRLDLTRERDAARRPGNAERPSTESVAARDDELRRALRKLRQGANQRVKPDA
jgi:hypothetical protein